MTSSNGNILRVTGFLCGSLTGPGEFPTQRPVTWSVDGFLDLRPNKRLSKQTGGWWFETPSWSLWRQCNGGFRCKHICVGNLTIIGSDNGLSPGRRQAIFRINAGILWIGPLGTNFGEILIGIQTFSFKKMHLKMSSGKWRPLCLGLNVLSAHLSILLNAGCGKASKPVGEMMGYTTMTSGLVEILYAVELRYCI